VVGPPQPQGTPAVAGNPRPIHLTTQLEIVPGQLSQFAVIHGPGEDLLGIGRVEQDDAPRIVQALQHDGAGRAMTRRDLQLPPVCTDHDNRMPFQHIPQFCQARLEGVPALGPGRAGEGVGRWQPEQDDGRPGDNPGRRPQVSEGCQGPAQRGSAIPA
jgi:hypothetical protein